MASKNVILMTKMKNALSKLNKNLTVELHNININGDKRGCSGFIRNDDNGTIVYVNTEKSVCSWGGKDHLLYRYAKNMKDYTGLSNRYASSFDELISSIDSALEKTGEDIR